MSGEMSVADLAEYTLHQAVADIVGGTLRPFDVYIGPYIDVPEGWIFLDAAGVTLWPGGVAPAYCNPIVVGFNGTGYDTTAKEAIWQARERAR